MVLLLVGLVLAAVQPGNLGDDEGASTAAPTTMPRDGASDGDGGTTTSTTATTPTTGAGIGDPEDPDGGTPDGGTGGTDGAPTSTTRPSSGLGTGGSGSAGEGDLADTGGLPFLLPGVLLLVAAGVSQRLSRRR